MRNFNMNIETLDNGFLLSGNFGENNNHIRMAFTTEEEVKAKVSERLDAYLASQSASADTTAP